jgi:DNA-directed RNA polymerase omega subunit
MDQMPDRIDSKFRYVLVAANRAEQIMRGSRPRVDRSGKPTRVAMEEIGRGLVQWDYGPPPQDEVADEAVEAAAAEAEEVEEVH